MKHKYLLPLAFLGLPLAGYCVPAYPGIIKLTNPDGTNIEVRVHGDQDFNYVTDVEGINILEQNAAGFWVQAERNGSLLKADSNGLEILLSEQMPEVAPAPAGPMRMANLTAEGRSTYPTIGEVHGLVVLLEYADVPYSVSDPRTAIDRKCNEEGYSEYYSKGSARDYFKACSNGQFSPIFDVTEVVPLKETSSYYAGNDGRNGTFGHAIKEAIEYLDEKGLDFSKYDYDEDGLIDNIFFYYSGYGQADTLDKNTIWPHQGDYIQYTMYHDLPSIVVDGVTMRTYACSCELSRAVPPGYSAPFFSGIGTFVHEYSHVLGLPDFYDVNYSGNTNTPGKWSVMDSGPYNDYGTCPPQYSAYEQWTCNWLEFIDAEPGTKYELPSLSNTDNPQAVRLRIRRPSGGATVRYYTEFYVIETRTPQNWDVTLPDEGMLVWHINFNRNTWLGNKVNTNGKCNVEIMPCNEDRGYTTWPGDLSYGGHNYVYPGYLDTFEPTNYAPDFEVFLTNIAFDSETGVSSFCYNMITEIPTEVTILHEPTRNERSSEIYLSWDAVENAQGYQLTVTRTDAKGVERLVDGLEEYNVGNVTEYTVRNISTTAAAQTFKAYVRVVMEIPAGEISNIQEFVANEVNVSGVDSVESEVAVIYGTVGAIVAPEGARAWSANGVETSLDNVAPGMYIVRYKDVVKKIIVK